MHSKACRAAGGGRGRSRVICVLGVVGAGLWGPACSPATPRAEPTAPPGAYTANPSEAGGGPEVASTATTRTGAAKADEGWLDPATAQAEATRILQEIAAARNLAATSPVNVDVVDRPGIREFAKSSMYEHITPEEMQLIGRVQASMGVIPRDLDPEQIVLDLLEEGVAGFYDPKEKTLFIGDFVDKVTLSMVVGHEIAHGLQDMHFDLQKHQLPLRHRNDEESARRFLIEGGAQATYLAWVSGESGLAAIDDGVLDAMGNQVLDLASAVSPYPILVRSLQLPYADGTATVARLVRQKGWGAVDALYEHLPESSEQMLHIDKLLARELPIVTTIDTAGLSALLPDTTQVWYDTLGEAELLSMLAEAEPSSVARRAAAGWGGDQYVAFDRQGDAAWRVPLVVGVVVWDSERDAIEFEEVFTKYLGLTVPDHAIDRRGDRVLFATGIPADVDASKLLTAAWKGVHTQANKRRRWRKDRE